jgi:hypothetical protein
MLKNIIHVVNNINSTSLHHTNIDFRALIDEVVSKEKAHLSELIDFEITATVIDTYLELRSSEDLNMTVYDKTGRSVKKRKITTQTTRVPMDDMPSGVYFVQLSNAKNNSQTIKVVKK